jgi:hypothetical protein
MLTNRETECVLATVSFDRVDQIGILLHILLSTTQKHSHQITFESILLETNQILLLQLHQQALYILHRFADTADQIGNGSASINQ